MKKLYSLSVLALCASLLSAQTYNMSTTPITTCTGTYYDSGGPSTNYGNGQNITQTFTSSTGDRLSFAFTAFAVETCCDRLYIYDGPTTAYPLIGIYTSNPGTIISSGNTITFRFTSDGSTTYAGWTANISCTTAPLTNYNLTNGTVTACAGNIFDSGGGGTNYLASENIVQTFCSGTTDFLQFSFLTAATAFASGDTLFIYDGPTVSAPLIGAYITGSAIESFTSTGTCVTFKFKSDAGTTAAGWAGSFACTSTPGGPGAFNMSSGIRGTCGGSFYDSGGPSGTYGNNETRTQTFLSNNGNRLQVTFSSFTVETCCDRLYIYDGPTNAYPLIGTFTSNPGTITATGTSLTFYFSSDGSNAYAGWAATFSCTTSPLNVYPITAGTITACSGVVTDNGGQNAPYLNGSNVTQTFSSGTTDYLSFQFWTAATSMVTGDTLWIYDGATTSAPLIGAYTQGSMIESFTSTGNSVTLHFVSNATGNSAGWAGWFTCTTTPGTIPSFNMSTGIRGVCSGTFYDSGGSTGTYANNESRVQTFISNNGNRLEAAFTSLTVETCCDRLYIYDGPSQSYPLIGVYTSNPGTVQATGTALTFYFVSDGSTTYAGWGATFSCTTAPLITYPITPGTITTCSGFVCDNGGPNGVYLNGTDVTQTFTSGTADFLNFQFWTAATSLITGDTLWIFDGPNISSPLIGAYTQGSTLESFTSSGNSVTFRLVTNAVSNANGYAGWFTCTTTPGGTPSFNMSTGIRGVCSANFYDSGGPTGNYSNSANQTQTFVSSTGERLQFTFSAFSVETCCDRLYIYDGPNTTYPLLGTFTSSPGTVTSSGNSITMRFTSDGSNTFSGWSASVACAGPVLPVYTMSSGTITTCGGVFYDAGGPSANYPNNENRVQTFTSASGQYLQFTFNSNAFSMEQAADSLFIYDGASTSAGLLAIYTGNSGPGVITSSTPSLTFRFKSNGVTVAQGWQAWIACVAVPNSNPVFNMNSAVIYTCGGTFHDAGGVSGNYANNENRTMTFYSNSGCGIRFTFSAFSTESCCDRLYVYDGPTIASPLIGTYAGSALPPVLQSSGNCLTFRFTSDGSSTYAGWSATISCPTQPLATITPSGPTNLCQGDSVILSAANNTSYLWSTGETTQNITVTNNGSYWCTVTNASGCTATSLIVVVSVSSTTTPAVTASGPTTFCQGDTVTLTSSGTGTFLWSNGATTSSINVTTGGTYSVTVTDGNGCSATSAATPVTVNAAPTPNISASGPVNICTGDSVILTASGGGNYNWSTGATSASITVNTSGTYDVTVTDINGCTGTSAPVTVNVYAYPNAQVTASGNTIFCAGGNVTLNATGGSTYQWSTGATSASILVSSGGNYYVVAYNAAGCADTSAPVSITVNSLPTVTWTVTQDTFCVFDPVYILTGGSPSGGSWSGPGVSGNTFDPATAGTGNHAITYSYTDSNGCQNSASDLVYVDICTGIPVIDSQNGMLVYPNPANDNVMIVWNGNAETIRIRDITGRIVLNQNVSGLNNITLSVKDLAQGSYTISVEGGEVNNIPLLISR